VGETLTAQRITHALSPYQFVPAIVPGLYAGFKRLSRLRLIARDSILTGILKVTYLPPQSTLWRMPASLHLSVARQILSIHQAMQERVRRAANVKLKVVTAETGTAVHTRYGRQMGRRKSYNPKNRDKRSYQPMPTFPAETLEHLWGELCNSDRPGRKQIPDHLCSVSQALPAGVERAFPRADSSCSCWEPMEAYEQAGCRIVIVTR